MTLLPALAYLGDTIELVMELSWAVRRQAHLIRPD
jgi:hypothetical protein